MPLQFHFASTCRILLKNNCLYRVFSLLLGKPAMLLVTRDENGVLFPYQKNHFAFSCPDIGQHLLNEWKPKAELYLGHCSENRHSNLQYLENLSQLLFSPLLFSCLVCFMKWEFTFRLKIQYISFNYLKKSFLIQSQRDKYNKILLFFTSVLFFTRHAYWMWVTIHLKWFILSLHKCSLLFSLEICQC